MGCAAWRKWTSSRPVLGSTWALKPCSLCGFFGSVCGNCGTEALGCHALSVLQVTDQGRVQLQERGGHRCGMCFGKKKRTRFISRSVKLRFSWDVWMGSSFFSDVLPRDFSLFFFGRVVRAHGEGRLPRVILVQSSPLPSQVGNQPPTRLCVQCVFRCKKLLLHCKECSGVQLLCACVCCTAQVARQMPQHNDAVDIDERDVEMCRRTGQVSHQSKQRRLQRWAAIYVEREQNLCHREWGITTHSKKCRLCFHKGLCVR